MDDRTLIDRLIDTYHYLNTHVRTTGDAHAGGASSIEAIVRTMRDDELHFSQSLKERISGVSALTTLAGEDVPVIGAEAEDESTAIMVAQFGSAREVTLALLRGLPDVAWDAAGENGATIRSSVVDLAATDEQRLAAIGAQLTGSVAT